MRLVRSENNDIRQKGDPARLAIAQCQLVVVNSYTTATSDIRDAPLTPVWVSDSVYVSTLNEIFTLQSELDILSLSLSFLLMPVL